jgi:Fur family ferric uptake transcriptional regulator
LGDDFSSHQHYVVCEKCGKSVVFDDQALEHLLRQITRQAGMRPTGHYIELLGVCERCRLK